MIRPLMKICFLFCMSISVNAETGIPADELFKQPDIFSMSLSPTGKYVLEVGRTKDQRILNLIDTTTLKKYRILTKPIDKSPAVIDYSWLDESTLYVEQEKKRFSFFQKSRSNAHIVKINTSTSPLQVTWYEIPVDGYVLSKPIDEQGNLIFAKTEGEFGEYYRLYRTTLDALLSNKLNRFQKHRTGLSDALFFSYDLKSDILIGYTYDDDEAEVWYLPPGDTFWSRLYGHDLEDEFTPLSFINKNSLAVLTNKNSNFTYVAEFDIKQQKFTQVIYKHPSHDLVDATLSKDGHIHSISYIQHGVRNTEYLSSDAKNVNESLSEHITDRKTVVIDTTENGNFRLVLAHASNTPGELYLFNSSLNKLNSLGMLRKNLTDYVLAKAEVFKVELEDGVLIEGIVTKPSLESNGVLIVNPHGGPIGERDYANFNLEHQFYASRGYTILNVNFRGSTGFGKSF